MAQLNSPSLKGLLKMLESQGRASDYRTRKSIYDLKGLNKRLGPYRGAESQNFALKNVVMREDEHDVRLMKSMSGEKHKFDVPGGSYHTGKGDPINAQINAVQKTQNVAIDPDRDPVSGKLLPIVGERIDVANRQREATLRQYYLSLPSTAQTPAEAAGLPPPQAGSFGSPISPPQMTTDALGNPVPTGVPGVNPQGIRPPSNVPSGGFPTPPASVLNAVQDTPRQTSLVDIYTSRPDLQSAFPSALIPGTPANQQLNDWFNQYGKKEYPNVQLVAPGSPGIMDPRGLAAPGGPPSAVPGAPGTPEAGATGAEDFLALGEQTPEGILAQREAKMAQEAADRSSRSETQSLQSQFAKAGLAFSGIRDKGEQELAAAQFARKEGISLDLAKTILSAASAELKRQQGEIREVGNKLLRIKPDGSTEVIYEDTSQLTPEQKLELEFKFRQKELELQRQSDLEMERVLKGEQLGRYEPTKGSSSSSSSQAQFTQTQLNKGAAYAGVPYNDFAQLDADTQNIFINNQKGLNDAKKAIDETDDPAGMEAQIAEQDYSPAVKDFLTKYLWSGHARPQQGNAPAGTLNSFLNFLKPPTRQDFGL